MSKSFEFWFDVGSPASWLAWTQVPQLARATGAEALYRPMLLGGVFQATANRSPMEVPVKGNYVMTDLLRHARKYGVPLNRNPHFPINTLVLMRGCVGLQLRDPGKFMAYTDAVFRAIWVDGANMGDPQVIGAVLHAAGFDPQALLALTQEAEVKDQLKAATQEAVAKGVFGAPTFIVDGQLFWGQDRLDFVKEALTS